MKRLIWAALWFGLMIFAIVTHDDWVDTAVVCFASVICAFHLFMWWIDWHLHPWNKELVRQIAESGEFERGGPS